MHNFVVKRVINNKMREAVFPRFAEIYKEAFSGPPYFENFTTQEVREIYDELIEGNCGYCSVMELDGYIVGICGGLCVTDNKGVSEEIAKSKFNANPDHIFYIAELAVDKKYRNHGLGSQMVQAMTDFASNHRFITHSLVRTQAKGSNALSIFKAQEFVEVPEMLQQVETFVRTGRKREKAIQERIFLVKKV